MRSKADETFVIVEVNFVFKYLSLQSWLSVSFSLIIIIIKLEEVLHN